MEVFVPGRLCILGEHTDWISSYVAQNPTIKPGYTLVCATNEGLYARVEHYETSKLKIRSINNKDEEFTMEIELDYEKLRHEASLGTFFSYIFGTTACLLQHPKYLSAIQQLKHEVGTFPGVFIDNYRTTLPLKKGLSSSAAISVLTVISFSKLLGIDLSMREAMELAYQGENLTPSRCGRMDQCVAMGAGAIAMMEFVGESCTLQRLRCPQVLHFVVVDLRASKDTVKILEGLNACFPVAIDDNQQRMHSYAALMVQVAADAQRAIEQGEVFGLAHAMKNAQQLFDDCAMPNCPSQLTSPRLHALMADTYLTNELALAVKGVGSQGDGSAQLLCSDSEHQQQALEYIRREYDMDGFVLTIPASE